VQGDGVHPVQWPRRSFARIGDGTGAGVGNGLGNDAVNGSPT
jgi:hypothetical protein